MSDSLRTTSLPRCRSSASMLGMERDPHLAPPGEDVDGAVVVGTEERSVGRRRLGQLLHLLAEVGDVLLGRLQGEGQLLVLRDGLGQLALGLEQLLLEGLDPARALLEAPAEDGDFLLGRLSPDPQRRRGRRRCPSAAGRRSSCTSSKSTVGITSFDCRHLRRPYTGGRARSDAFACRTRTRRRPGRGPDLTDRQPPAAAVADSIEARASVLRSDGGR